ncbi:MAG: RNA-binding protein [Candidatus Obscuribacterales bacterium]|nr:RNA-binding protein [Candidatus Obscuribacterales bacterium]
MSCKILIGNLDTEADEDGIREFVLPIMSQVLSLEVPIEARTGKNRGYAYVVVRTEEEAHKAVRLLHGRNSLGRNLTLTVVEGAPVKGKWYKFGAV